MDRLDRPTAVCLCSRVRFLEAFDAASPAETLAGRIALSIGGYDGESTRAESVYARTQGQPVRWLEPHND